jgi:hypothetical protein
MGTRDWFVQMRQQCWSLPVTSASWLHSSYQVRFHLLVPAVHRCCRAANLHATIADVRIYGGVERRRVCRIVVTGFGGVAA